MDKHDDLLSGIEALDSRLRGISRSAEPVRWATASYRLGLARAESPTGQPAENLRAALALYEDAASVLTADAAPLENARVINAAGSAHRLLGDSARSVELFSKAAGLMEGRAGDAERAAVLSNLGLGLAEIRNTDDAVDAFTRALELLDGGEDSESRRARVASRHNLALALMAAGDVEDLGKAIEALLIAEEECVEAESPLHQAMVWHSLGVARKGQAEVDHGARAELLDLAIADFERSLTIFTVASFPFQHAIAKHNLGLAQASRGDIGSARRALLSYVGALGIFDPRLHGAHWREAQSNLEDLEGRLAETDPGFTREDHIASVLGDMDEIERLAALRQLLAGMERLPADRRLTRLSDLATAVVRRPPRSFVATLQTMIVVLMELPDETLRAALEAQMIAHARLDPHDRRSADFILDEAINALLFGPQRIRVRDTLTEIGWHRP